MMALRALSKAVLLLSMASLKASWMRWACWLYTACVGGLRRERGRKEEGCECGCKL